MSNATIIKHSGLTKALSKAIEEGGNSYRFLFHAATPEEKRWAYRLLHSDDPTHLTEAQLLTLLQGERPTLRAEWEEQVGHPIGIITVYLPPHDGTSDERQARFEPGPELDRTLTPIKRGPDHGPGDDDKGAGSNRTIGNDHGLDLSF